MHSLKPTFAALRAAVATLAACLVAIALSVPAGAADSGYRQSRGPNGEVEQNSCSLIVAPAHARCHAHVRVDAKARSASPARVAKVQPFVLGNNGAYDPSYLQSAYNIPAAQGANQTVAIVDAYDDPNVASDLAYYRSYFGLPAVSSNTATSPWFRKVNQTGGTSSPAADAGWGQEISLDVDMVSAICPHCNILLVEANSNSLADLGASVNEAVALGAVAVSNSYGGSEYSGEATDSSTYYNHPGIAITVSSGDNGYGVEFPAASNTVTAVGGTSLQQATNTGTRNATETAWSGAGSGCSAYEGKPGWQSDSGCSRRTVADVSAVADPNTGVWVYDTQPGQPYGANGFQVFGGTSVASPIVGSVYALAGKANSTDTLASYPYSHTTSLFDITSGSNGSCGGSYLCTAGTGYDGPTGLGTPNSTGAFVPAGPPPGHLTLSFSSASITAGSSTTGTVGLVNADGTTGSAPSGGLSVSLSSSSAKGSFTPASPITVAAGASSANFSYSDTAAGTATVTASASGWNSASASLSISAGSASHLAVSPASASLPTGGSQTFTASATDAYGNPADAGGTTWTLSSGLAGTLSCSGPCASTTFTAGDSASSGTVNAALAGTPGASANVTVSAQGFTLSVTPSSQSISHGSTAYYTVNINRTGGFNGAVSLSLSGCPAYSYCSFSSNPTTGSSDTLSIRTWGYTPRSTYTLTVNGTASGQPKQSASPVTLTVY